MHSPIQPRQALYTNLSKLLEAAPTRDWKLSPGGVYVASGEGSVLNGLAGKALALKTGAIDEDATYGYEATADADGVSQSSSGITLVADDTNNDPEIQIAPLEGEWTGIMYEVDLSSTGQVLGASPQTSTRVEVGFVRPNGDSVADILYWDGTGWASNVYTILSGVYDPSGQATGRITLGTGRGLGLAGHRDSTAATTGEPFWYSQTLEDLATQLGTLSTFGRKFQSTEIAPRVSVHRGGAGGQLTVTVRAVRLRSPVSGDPT
jgi:hypothetical protein